MYRSTVPRGSSGQWANPKAKGEKNQTKAIGRIMSSDRSHNGQIFAQVGSGILGGKAVTSSG
jgi:hypothetical protein